MQIWEMEPGKLFVGGISWDTNEDRLRDYFQTFGEVVEAVIMKDRTTGRARGFGFVIYADPSVAELVVRQKHIIDGRTVEAKKAVPRDDQQHILPRNQMSPTLSPIVVRTKKIFVGGLPSTVTEVDFKRHFDQFGVITDVVVMYDHNTQRPRGFGFITFDSEEAVERTLFKTFHELNGKMVEVKRAVPKELSPAPNRTPLVVGNLNSFINGYGINLDERHMSPISYTRNVLINPPPPFSPSNYGSALNYERRVSPNFGFNGLQPSNVSVTPPNRNWSLWGNTESDNSLKSREAIWGSSPLRANMGLSSVGGLYGTHAPLTSSSTPFGDEATLGGGQSWSRSFEFGLGNGVSDVPLNNPTALCW